jgi:hypothetical protein
LRAARAAYFRAAFRLFATLLLPQNLMKNSTLMTIIDSLRDADSLLTDRDDLDFIEKQFGPDDSTYLWAKQARTLVQELEEELQRRGQIL